MNSSKIYKGFVWIDGVRYVKFLQETRNGISADFCVLEDAAGLNYSASIGLK